MWRLVVVASLLLTLALGTAASAKCRICVESVGAISSGSAVTLEVVARSMVGDELPDHATAVVMQFDGQPSKCLNVALTKVDQVGPLATYRGTFSLYGGTSTYSGRIDVGGDIHEFTAALDGALARAREVSSASVAAPRPIAPVPAAPVPAAPAPVAAPSEPEPARSQGAARLPGLPQGTTLLAVALLVTVTVTTYLDRKRALERSRAG